MFSLISLWQTQALVISTSQQIANLKYELLSKEEKVALVNIGPAPPSGDASSNTASQEVENSTPFVKHITKSLHGTVNRIRHKYHSTTINTPLQIDTTQLIQDATNGTITNITLLECNNGIANTSVDLNILTYYPNAWYQGYDTLRYTIQVQKEDGSIRTVDGSTIIRIRTGVVLNKALLRPPAVYTFSETSQAETQSIREFFESLRLFNSSVVPEHDTWINRRYKTCAVVGNGGSLKGSKRGAEIDAHDMVVRLNVSPLKGFEKDIGRKMSLSLAGGAFSGTCWIRDDKVNFVYDIMPQATFRQQWGQVIACPKLYVDIKYLPMNYLFVDLVDRILNEYHTKMFNETDKKYRSTGMLAVTAMAMICDHVSVYGFERGPNMENNYYESTNDREWSGHSYEAEKEYYRDLAKGTGLFEPFLELYDLYTSFSYIVD